jgi:hypothetical protein
MARICTAPGRLNEFAYLDSEQDILQHRKRQFSWYRVKQVGLFQEFLTIERLRFIRDAAPGWRRGIGDSFALERLGNPIAGVIGRPEGQDLTGSFKRLTKLATRPTRQQNKTFGNDPANRRTTWTGPPASATPCSGQLSAQRGAAQMEHDARSRSARSTAQRSRPATMRLSPHGYQRIVRQDLAGRDRRA